MSEPNPLIPPSQSKIKPPYIPPPKPSVRTIPLHIADQAVAACEKEIQELRAEVARLRASSFVTAVPVEQYERLIKAGDAMADAINEHRHGKGGAWGEGFIVRENWKTAKGGNAHA